MSTQARRKWGLGSSLDELLAEAASLEVSVVEAEVSAQSAAMTRSNVEGPHAAARARDTAAALATDAALRAKVQKLQARVAALPGSAVFHS